MADDLKKPEILRAFHNDYASEDVSTLAAIQPGKVYEATLEDGNTYRRVTCFPWGIHAYYDINGDAVRTHICTMTSLMDFGNIDSVIDDADLS